jgi:hypothetical protein
LFIALLYCRSLGLGKSSVDLVYLFGLGEHSVCDEIYKFQQSMRCVSVITKAERTGMDGFIPDNSYAIERSLDSPF